MTFWMRAATLQLGTSQFSMKDLNFSFEVAFEDNVQLCKARVTVYNLSPATRNQIRQGMQIIINAGYEEDMGVIFVGEVDKANHEKQAVDWLTKIEATASLKTWVTADINKTYKQHTRAKDIVPDLLNIFGVEVNICELAEDKEYPRGRVCKGKLANVLQEIVVSDCKSRLLIRNNQIIINDPADGMRNGYLLSPATGLLRAAVDKDETAPVTALETKKEPEARKEAAAKMSCECLLNHHFGVADEIKVQSEKLNGNFVIIRGTHKGDRAGDWKTIIEVRPA